MSRESSWRQDDWNQKSAGGGAFERVNVKASDFLDYFQRN